MSTKEQILAEMDGLSQEELEELYMLVKQFLYTQRQGSVEPGLLELSIQLPVDSAQDSAGMNAWDVLEKLAGTITAPEDWATEHDHYLYGAPKRQEPSLK